MTKRKLERAGRAIFVHRMSLWLWISIGLLVAIYFLARHMLSVALYKLVLITIAGYVGFALSLALEGCLVLWGPRRKRPHEYQADAAIFRGKVLNLTGSARFEMSERAWHSEVLAIHMLWRRAVIVSAVLLAAAMGG